jgi:DNA-binding MarR family transcriptional regulator
MGEGELRDIAMRLHKVSIRLLRTLRREDDDSGLSAPRLSALSVVVFAGPISLGQLADAEQVRAPTMSRIVDALVEAGLVTREIRPDDRRAVSISATDKGRALMEAGRERRVRRLAHQLETLADSEIRALGRGIELIERITR